MAETAGCEMGNLPSWPVLTEVAANGMQQMGFTQAVSRPNEQRIVAGSGIVGDGYRGLIREPVRGSDDEIGECMIHDIREG